MIPRILPPSTPISCSQAQATAKVVLKAMTLKFPELVRVLPLKSKVPKLVKKFSFEEAKNYLFKEALNLCRDHRLFIQLIVDYPKMANLCDASGNTLLMLILTQQVFLKWDWVIIHTLLNQMNVYSINFYNDHGTVLHQECLKNKPSIKIVSLLLQKGANPTLVNLCKCSPLDLPTPLDVKNLMQDYANERFKIGEYSILPTLVDLTKQYNSKEMACNMSWALQAVRFVRREAVIGPHNQPKNLIKTKNWSFTMCHRMHNEYIEFFNTVPHDMLEASIKKTELVIKYRCGECFYQTSVAYTFLAKKGVKKVEYFAMEEGSHHFLVIGRNLQTTDSQPTTWNRETVICDPWLNACFFVDQFFMKREFSFVYQTGVPAVQFST